MARALNLAILRCLDCPCRSRTGPSGDPPCCAHPQCSAKGYDAAIPQIHAGGSRYLGEFRDIDPFPSFCPLKEA